MGSSEKIKLFDKLKDFNLMPPFTQFCENMEIIEEKVKTFSNFLGYRMGQKAADHENCEWI